MNRARGEANQNNIALDIGKRIECLIKLAEYHRKAMEARRLVSFTAFLALVGLDGALLINAQEFLEKTQNVWQVVAIVCGFALVALLVFIHATIHIESKSVGDRDKYVFLESEAWKILDEKKWKKWYDDYAGLKEKEARGGWRYITEAWGSAGPIIISALFFIILVFHVWLVATQR